MRPAHFHVKSYRERATGQGRLQITSQDDGLGVEVAHSPETKLVCQLCEYIEVEHARSSI